MRTLFFGGSFNPVHHGHLICARAVAEGRGLARVVLVPSAQPPHKQADAQLAAPQDRLEMCRRAVADSALFGVDDLELKRSGPSYTIETVRELKRRGVQPVTWLIGADMLAILPKWYQAEALLSEAEFVVMARPGWSFDWQTLPPRFRFLQTQVAQAPLIEISATEIRRRVGEGKSIEFLVPPGVRQYIEERGLYRRAGAE